MPSHSPQYAIAPDQAIPDGLRDAIERKGFRQQELRARMDPILSTAQHAVLEIGCGHGHWLTAYATAHPATTCIGLDIISQRVAKSQLKATKRQLNNLHFIKAEAIEFIEILPPSVSFDWIMVLFPDPWPKKRHHRRRLIQPSFLDLIHPFMTPDGKLCFRTDDDPYFSWARDIIGNHPKWRLDEPTIWPFECETLFQAMMDHWQSLSAGIADGSQTDFSQVLRHPADNCKWCIAPDIPPRKT